MEEYYYFNTESHLNPKETESDLIPEEKETLFEDEELFTYEQLPDGTYSIRLKDRTNCPKSISIPDKIASEGEEGEGGDIGAEANYCIPITVSAIAERGFSDCKELTSIYIPKSVTFIGVEAFSGSGLVEIIVDSDNPVYRSEGNCIIDKYDGKIIAGCSVSVIPEDKSVTSIGDYAFSGCKELEDVYIPNNIEMIGQLAFHRCENIKKLTIGEGVDTISYGAFSSCSSLETVTIPYGVRYIGAVAFAKCKNLKEAVIPGSVEILGGDIFSECDNIREIIFEGSRSQWKRIHRADIMDSARNDSVIFADDRGFSIFGRRKPRN